MVKGFPLNQQEYSYNAQEVSYYYAGRHSGVFALGTNCQASITSGMNVKVSKGKGWLAHGVDYGIVFWLEEDVTVTVPIGDSISPRWDFVCVGWETKEVKENPKIYIKSGTPAYTPYEPTLENSQNKIEICLAKIFVPAGTSSLTSSGVNIVDTRDNKSYCGLVGDDLRTTNLEKRVDYIEQGITPAGSATKLNFKRKINGTDFDGSKDINTEKWGSKRNFTIDSIVKEIDGSSNIVFSTINIQEETIASGGTYTDGGVTKKGEKKLLILKNSGSFYIQKQSIRQLVIYSNNDTNYYPSVSATILEAGTGSTGINISDKGYPAFVFIIGV